MPARRSFSKTSAASLGLKTSRICIYEDKGRTHVTAQNASALFSGYNGLEDLGKRVDEMLLSILKVIE